MATEKKVDHELNRRLLELRDLYVTLYRQGATIKLLQQRVSKDFAERGIKHKATGFVERAIYSYIAPGRKI